MKVLDDAVEIKMEHIDTIVEQHMGFLIRTVSSMTGRYVAVEHDDAFSVGLEAFVEAVERYDPVSYTHLVLRGDPENPVSF